MHGYLLRCLSTCVWVFEHLILTIWRDWEVIANVANLIHCSPLGQTFMVSTLAEAPNSSYLDTRPKWLSQNGWVLVDHHRDVCTRKEHLELHLRSKTGRQWMIRAGSCSDSLRDSLEKCRNKWLPHSPVNESNMIMAIPPSECRSLWSESV